MFSQGQRQIFDWRCNIIRNEWMLGEKQNKFNLLHEDLAAAYKTPAQVMWRLFFSFSKYKQQSKFQSNSSHIDNGYWHCTIPIKEKTQTPGYIRNWCIKWPFLTVLSLEMGQRWHNTIRVLAEPLMTDGRNKDSHNVHFFLHFFPK